MSFLGRAHVSCAAVFVVLTVTVNASAEELQIKNVRHLQGNRGLPKSRAEFYPGEELACRFDVTGFARDDDGMCDTKISVALYNANHELQSTETGPFRENPWKSDDVFVRLFVVHDLPADLPAGKYSLVLTVDDQLASQSATRTEQIVVKPCCLSLISPTFFLDPQMSIATRPQGFVGQHLMMRVVVVGFQCDENKSDIEFHYEILDTSGQRMVRLNPPYTFGPTDFERMRRNRQLKAGFKEPIHLCRPGDYIIRMTVNDKLANKTATLDVPLKVLDDGSLDSPGELATQPDVTGTKRK
jgi:hypothetical protein